MDITAKKIIVLSFCILLSAILFIGCNGQSNADLRSPCAAGDSMNIDIASRTPCIKRDVEMNVYFM
ncbi:hypothetical protein Fokcrypt_00328 [Candidatus Fokinia cryptica]|uniref:Uncharacterized protein n=1 Tax=Candidatus Fokinia crypta TaxID=1920990 RepID=A0ABZ0UNV3_9RICK|nr:hypothetical protein Fokcrypt_00328 [Candidatus Fokinia cryptica]